MLKSCTKDLSIYTPTDYPLLLPVPRGVNVVEILNWPWPWGPDECCPPVLEGSKLKIRFRKLGSLADQLGDVFGYDWMHRNLLG